jgi:acetyl/propionyl-CoA carboxylase alpha subunit
MKLALGERVHEVAATPVRLRRLRPGSFELMREGGTEVFHCVKDGAFIYLHWRGRAYELRILGDGRRRAERAAPGSLEAPMPGKVIKVSVAVGQRVKKGEEILVVEAMKMENQLRAPRDGTVVRLAAKPGDMVGPGASLAEIE